ncbi:MAG: hypothetical protein RLO08_16060 [Parvibaculaceae bacterium]
MAFIRPVSGFLAALIVMIVLGSIASTHFVLQGLSDLGTEITLSDRLSMTLQDIGGIAPLYGAIFGTGLLIAFIVAIFVTRLAPSLRWLVYTVAGATAMLVTMIALQVAFDGIMPISGARTTGGFLAQIAVGALAGFTFASLTPRRAA